MRAQILARRPLTWTVILVRSTATTTASRSWIWAPSSRATGCRSRHHQVRWPNPVLSGNRLTYTVTVTNNGLLVATGVPVADPLPSSLRFNSVASTQGGTITCTLGQAHKRRERHHHDRRYNNYTGNADQFSQGERK